MHFYLLKMYLKVISTRNLQKFRYKINSYIDIDQISINFDHFTALYIDQYRPHQWIYGIVKEFQYFSDIDRYDSGHIDKFSRILFSTESGHDYCLASLVDKTQEFKVHLYNYWLLSWHSQFISKRSSLLWTSVFDSKI